LALVDLAEVHQFQMDWQADLEGLAPPVPVVAVQMGRPAHRADLPKPALQGWSGYRKAFATALYST
jgi:hypothetical protein